MQTKSSSRPCGSAYELEINPDSLPQDVADFLCDLDVGTLLAGDYFFAVTKAGNGECTFKRIGMDELCARLSECNTGDGGGDDCSCEVTFDIDPTGHLIVTFADMTTTDLGLVTGQPATPCIPCADGNDGNDGGDGTDGTDGDDGDDGRGIVNASIDGAGDLILTYSSAPLTQNVGPVVGAPAPPPQNNARYTGTPSTGSTSYVSGMTVAYSSGDAFFVFDTPMANSDYFVSVTSLDGTSAAVPITGRSPTGFSMLDPIPAGTVSILAHA